MEEGVDVSHGSPTDGSAEQDDGTVPSNSLREPDIFLPIGNISHIMKRVLPANAKISKEAKESLQECLTEFISFITSEANDRCLIEKRSTINGDDLIWAFGNLGFENYVEPLTAYLHRYRELEEDSRISGRSSGLSVEKDGSGSTSLPNVQILDHCVCMELGNE